VGGGERSVATLLRSLAHGSASGSVLPSFDRRTNQTASSIAASPGDETLYLDGSAIVGVYIRQSHARRAQHRDKIIGDHPCDIVLQRRGPAVEVVGQFYWLLPL
jgi:hypothetical protein